MADLAGKVAIVTGASSGIGAATARHLARAGVRVVLAARNLAALEQVAREVTALGSSALVIPTDVRDPAQCAALVERTLAEWGRLDILINNAGLGYSNRVGMLNADEVRAQIDTDLTGVIWCCNAAVPAMLNAGRGAIINIGSVAGRIGLPTSSVYCAAKFGLDGFTQGLRTEVQRRGVAVSLLNPGFVATDFSRRASRGGVDTRSRPGPEMSSDDVAAAILRLLQRPRRQVVMTWPYAIATGIARLLPGLTAWIMARVGARMA
jgi:NADP-dependent 3-hydroxy acid dehydrogenase YdfG